MALTADAAYQRRGLPGRNEFGYPVAAGEKVFRGSIIAVNAAGAVVRVQTAGAVQIIGLADHFLDNSGSASVSTDRVVGLKGTYALTVPSATAANINATVYASDDNTLTLTQGTLLAAGVLVGIEGGQTFVQMIGS
jgi:uncharacterized membrane protein (DUF2068 family)